MIEAAILVIFPMLVAFGGASDLLTMKIQNRVSLLLIAGFVIVALGTGLSLQGWGIHLLGMLPVFLVCFGFFAINQMGGGDVKFISAISLWIGFGPVLTEFILLFAIYGALLTLGLMQMRTVAVVPGPLARQEWFLRLHDKSSGIPYGIAIAIAGLQIYPSTVWFKALAQSF